MEKLYVNGQFCNTDPVLIGGTGVKLVFGDEYTEFMEDVFKKRYPDFTLGGFELDNHALPTTVYAGFVRDLQLQLKLLRNNALLRINSVLTESELKTVLASLLEGWEVLKVLHNEFITTNGEREGFVEIPEIWEGSPAVEGPCCFFVLDVESIGLHGESFAVGFTVVLHDGKTLEEGLLSCPVQEASSRDSSSCGLVPVSTNADGSTSWEIDGDLTAGLKWVNENVPTLTITHANPEGVRNAFWERWLYWRERGAVMVADCAWPVEVRFLLACVAEHLPTREWQGPYPLHDLATLLMAQGHNPVGTFKRLPSELPAHNPLCDARQSARILLDLLKNKGLSMPDLK